MKRLLKKAENQLPPIGEETPLQADEKYKDRKMSDLSSNEYRTCAVIVNTKTEKVYFGENGEQHADMIARLYSEFKEAETQSNQHVSLAIYIENFLMNPTIIIFHDVAGATEVIKKNYPNFIIYKENFSTNKLTRLAKKKFQGIK